MDSDEDCLSIDYFKTNKNTPEILNNFTSSESENYSTIWINKCPSIIDAAKIISESQLRTAILRKFPSLIAIILNINDDFYANDISKPRRHEFEDKERFVIAFVSSVSEKMIVYWKNEDSFDFLQLSLIDGNTSAAVNNFTLEFIIKNLKIGDQVTPTNSNEIHLTNIINPYGFDLLCYASYNGNLEIIQELLKHPFDVNKELNGENGICRLIDFIWQNDQHEILLELLKANSFYPANFDESETTEEVCEFLWISEDMHSAIKRNIPKEVIRILNENNGLRFFFNQSNKSAAKMALKYENFEIYKILAENNVTFGPNEFIENTENEFREEVSELNSELAKNLPQRHILQLLSKCVVPHTDCNTTQRLKQIKQAFEKLNLIPQITPALQILANDKECKFHFDFNNNSAIYMDPTLRQGTSGFFNLKTHHLLIAAKNLLDDDLKNDSYGTISHEVHHSVINSVFRNERLPFSIDDDVNREKFEIIIEECEKLKEHENIVENVFKYYNKAAWGRELAVRVPHMLAFYHDDQKKLKELQEIFKSLFEYHEQVVVSEMTAAVPVFEKLANESKEIKFDDLTEPLKTTILHSEVKFQGVYVKLMQIVGDKNSAILKSLNSNQIREILDGKVVMNISDCKISKNDNYIERFFIDKRSKTILLNIDSIMTKVANSRTFLLSDHAGSGKSTCMKYLSVKMKEKLPDFWISYVDLKRHLDVYKKFDKSLNFDQILKIFVEILPINGSLEMSIVMEYIKSGKMILILDGFDEIIPKYEEFFINFVTNIKEMSKIQLWISTRPLHSKELAMKINSEIYSFKPFNEQQVLSYTEQFLSSKKFINPQKVVEDIKLISSKLKFIDNPLMLRMLVELYVAGKLTLKNLNRFSLYQAMIELKKDILAEEIGAIAIRDLIIDSKITLPEVHQIFALKLLLAPKDIGELQIIKRWKKKRSNWSNEAVSRFGLLIVTNWNTAKEKPEFVHQTFAEYFLATFLIESVREAVETDDDDLTEKEFAVRMKLIDFLLLIYCDYDLTSEVSRGFISDYLSNPLVQKVAMSRKFLNYVEENSDELIEKYLKSTQRFIKTRFLNFFTSFVKILYQNREQMKSEEFLTRIRQTLITAVFDAMENADFEINNCQFLINCAELHILNEKMLDDATKTRLNNGFLVTTDETDEVRENYHQLEVFYQFFTTSFLNDDFKSYREQVMFKFARNFPLLILKSRLMIEKFFEVLKQFFNEEYFIKNVSRNFLKCFADQLLPNIKLNDEFHKNVYLFFSKMEIFLNFDRELMRKALPSPNDDYLPYFQYFFMFCMLQSEQLRKFYLEHFEIQELFKNFSQTFSTVFEERILTENDVKVFDQLICEHFKTDSTLKFLIFSQANLTEISNICETFIESFGEEKWENNIGYPEREPKFISETTAADELMRIAAEIFEVTKGKKVHSYELKQYQKYFLNLYKLFNLFISREIPVEKIEKFFEMHFEGFMKIITENFMILDENLSKLSPFVDKLFDCIDCYFNNTDQKSPFFNILMKFRIFQAAFKIPSKDPTVFLHCIYGNLDRIMRDNVEFLNQFALIESIDHLFIDAINLDRKNIIKVYLKCLNREKILNHFIQSFAEDSFVPTNLENFETFLSDFFAENISYKKVDDFVKKDHSVTTIGTEIFTKIKAEIFLQILNLISQSKLDNIESFLLFNISIICYFALRSRTMIDKIFEILKINFNDCKSKTVRILKFATVEFFDKIDNLTTDCASNIEYFWSNVGEFLGDDSDAMKKVLLGIYPKSNHPLIIAIYFNFDNLLKFYFDQWSCDEILEVLFENLKTISKFFESDRFEKYLNQYFVSDSFRKEEFEKYLEKNEKEIFDLIDEELENYKNCRSVLKNQKQENLKQFRDFLKSFIMKNQAEKKELNK